MDTRYVPMLGELWHAKRAAGNMWTVSSIQGHFDGKSVVLDEAPAHPLAVGQPVRVVVDAPAAKEVDEPPLSTSPKRGLGAWKGKLQILEEGDEVILDHFKEYLP